MSGMKKLAAVCLSTVLLLVVAGAGTAMAAGPWKGKEINEDGSTRVQNPAEAIEKPTTIDDDELWRIGGEDDEEIFGVITDIISDDDGNFYMLDSQLNEIKVYDGDGEYLRTIGSRG